VDDLDHLLRGAEALGHLCAVRPLLDAARERLHHPHVDVGLEQRETDLTRDLVDVLLGELPAPTEALEDPVEAVGQ